MRKVLQFQLHHTAETQEPAKSFGKREKYDGSEYSNGGAMCNIKRWVYAQVYDFMLLRSCQHLSLQCTIKL